MSNIDIGIPVGGCIALSGSDVIPVNFRSMNGAVLDEPRSPFNGTTLPNWNRDDVQTVLTQVTPYDGSVIEPSTTTFSFSEGNLPANISLNKEYAVKFTVSSSTTKATGVGGGTTLVFNSGNTFTHNTWYGTNVGSVDGSDIGSGSQYYYKHASSIGTQNLNSHTHSITYGVHSHGFTNFSNHADIGSHVNGITPNKSYLESTYTASINGSSSPTSITARKERPSLKMHWYIRVY